MLRGRFADVARRALGKEDKESILLMKYLPQIYSVRSRFNDEMSRHLFDEAIVLRLAGHNRFSMPRYDFSEFLSVISKVEFSDPELPCNFLGIPLSIFTVSLPEGLSAINSLPIVFIGINNLVDLVNKWRQYFLIRDNFRVIPTAGDVVFDCGACLGEISVLFGAMVGITGSVHMFDPVPLHNRFLRLQKSYNPTLDNILYLNEMAVGVVSETINHGQNNEPKDISPGGLELNHYQITSLDDYADGLKLDKVDFIKMDIEGFEIPAIKGARRIIERYKPRLAISVYHRSDDIWKIPELICQLNPNYRFAFGHH